MNLPYLLVPHELSDEAAAQLSELLNDLAVAFDGQYFAQITRYYVERRQSERPCHHGQLELFVDDDVARASSEVAASLDTGFFRARFDRLTPARKRYLRAMADLGPGPHRSGEIARALDRKVTALGPTRAQLIAKGMIWSAARGEAAFTVPSFDRFMRRVMPGDEWRE